MNDRQNIIIVTALPFEGASVRRYLNLSPIEDTLPYFSGPMHHLVVSGVGKARCAAATGAICSRFSPEQIGVVVNIGVAGGISESTPIGSSWLIHQICDAATERRFYPDMLAGHHLQETLVTTFDKPVTTKSDAPTKGLVDMEASAFFEAASMFVGPEKIVCAKIVSDILLSKNRINTEKMSTAITTALPDILTYTENVCKCNAQTPMVTLTETHRKYMANLTELLQLTRTQQAQLTQSVIRFVQKNPTAALPEFIPSRVLTARERNQHFVQFQKELLG